MLNAFITMKSTALFCVIFLCYSFGQISHIKQVSTEKSIWLLNLINHIQLDTRDTMDIVIVPTLDVAVDQIFNRIRLVLGLLDIPKSEASINVHVKGRFMYLIDGTNAEHLKQSLNALKNSSQGSKNLANLSTQYLVAVLNTQVTKDHEAAFKSAIACHMILLDVSSAHPKYYRIASGDKRRLNSSLADILDDRHDWSNYEVRIQTVGTRPPLSKLVNGEYIGLDIEVCRAVFGNARIRYRFVAAPMDLTYSRYRVVVERNLAYGSIDLIISRGIFLTPFAEQLYLYDKVGLCLILPKNLSRNVVYHLVHPFELNIWILIMCVILLDVMLTRFFSNNFPCNLIMVLLFGNVIPDHRLGRWARFYWFACTVMLFILSEAYLTKVIHYMTITRYAPDKRNLKEVLESSIQLKVPAGTKQQLLDEEITLDIYWSILQRMIEVEDFRYDQLDSDFGTMLPCHFGDILIKQHIRRELEMLGYREAKCKFYLLDEMLEWNWRYFAVAKHFTYYGRMSVVISWLYETGLWDKWKRDFSPKSLSYNPRYALWDEDNILGLEDIAAVWYLLGLGWIVAGGVMILEGVWFRMNQWLSQKKRYL